MQAFYPPNGTEFDDKQNKSRAERKVGTIQLYPFRELEKGEDRQMALTKTFVAVGVVLSLSATALWAQDAKALYEKNCVSCHGATGKGDGPAGKFLKPQPKDFSAVLGGKADDQIVKVINAGGKENGLSASMPSFKGKLTDDQIKEIVQYVKSFAK